MPEGDTIHRVAGRLAPVLVGQELRAFHAPTLAGPAPRVGETITAVEAAGKHLLIRFSGGLTLETHMRMTGTWNVYRPTPSARRPGPGVRVLIETDAAVAVCRKAPIVRTWRHPDAIAHLGPDLCRLDADVDDVVARMQRADANTEIGDALLDQRLAAGIGNVYKSEVLHACGVDPFRTLGEFGASELHAIVATAARLMRANLGPGRRATVPGGLAVYRRAGRPCPRCRTPIVMLRQGEYARSTYYCPKCQSSSSGKNEMGSRRSHAERRAALSQTDDQTEYETGNETGNDDDIVQRINALADEEHELERAHAGTSLSPGEQRRMRDIEVALDQCWDLLRQRRARRHAGQDPDEAEVRAESVVERYRQ